MYEIRKGRPYRYITLFFVVLVIFLMMRFITGPCMVSGISMEDTLYNGDFLLSERTGYYFHDPQRFDVVEFYPGEDTSIQYIKRVIGLPGKGLPLGKMKCSALGITGTTAWTAVS